MTIRPATAADEATIRRMVAQERLDPTTLNWRHFKVAEDDGQIVGIGQIKVYGGVHELGSLIVLPAFRGRGIGGALIGTLEAEVPRPLYLLCRDTMIPYYERFGYRTLHYREAPGALKLKLLLPFVARLFGLHVGGMIKD